MKRLKISDDNIYKFTPFFFWTKCDKCGYEFKREKMWRIILLKRYNTDSFYKDICLHCLPTLQDAIKFRELVLKEISEVKSINPTPPPPLKKRML